MNNVLRRLICPWLHLFIGNISCFIIFQINRFVQWSVEVISIQTYKTKVPWINIYISRKQIRKNFFFLLFKAIWMLMKTYIIHYRLRGLLRYKTFSNSHSWIYRKRSIDQLDNRQPS